MFQMVKNMYTEKITPPTKKKGQAHVVRLCRMAIEKRRIVPAQCAEYRASSVRPQDAQSNRIEETEKSQDHRVPA